MPESAPTKNDRELSALLEEYRALYELVVFRMTALDRRAPVTAGAFAAALVSVQALPLQSQFMILLAAPPAMIWLVRTTVNHARSFEDVLRRIEQIERAVNRLLGKRVLRFQSLHPSRGKYVGGRTGNESVTAVLGSIVMLLLACGYQMHQLVGESLIPQIGYVALLAIVVVLIVRERVKLGAYRYAPAIRRFHRDYDEPVP